MTKCGKFVFIAAAITLCLLPSSHFFASTTTKVSGEIIPGTLTMTTPNDLYFEATLNGKEQILKLNPISANVSDYRGQDEGWQLSVSSPNFDSYAMNYQLTVNRKKVTKSENIVYLNNKHALNKNINLPVVVDISKKAQAGSYGANLVWNLQPSVAKTLRE